MIKDHMTKFFIEGSEPCLTMNQSGFGDGDGVELRKIRPKIEKSDVADRVSVLSTDYGPAVWEGGRYFTDFNRPIDQKIDLVILHTIEGSFEGALGWWWDVRSNNSTHYAVANDGRVAQIVREQDVAWHCGFWEWNKRSIGVEHEGIAASGPWTNAKLNASARLTAAVCKKYSIPIDRNHIKGHSEVPGCASGSGGGTTCHHDPGGKFPWAEYLSRVKKFAGQDSGGGETPTPVTYRVFAGAFTTRAAAQTQVDKVGEVVGVESVVVFFRGFYRAQCGSFAQRNNATDRLALVEARGFDAMVMDSTGKIIETGGVFQGGDSVAARVERALDFGLKIRGTKYGPGWKPGEWPAGPSLYSKFDKTIHTVTFILRNFMICTGFTNSLRGQFGLPAVGRAQGDSWPGGTAAYWRTYRGMKGVEPYIRGKKYRRGTLLISPYEGPSLALQGHVSVALGDGRVAQSWTVGGVDYTRTQEQCFLDLIRDGGSGFVLAVPPEIWLMVA